MVRLRIFAVLAAAMLGLTACGPPPLSLNAEGTTLTVSGVIGTEALEDFKAMIEENPTITTLVLDFVPGTIDVATNVKLGRLVRARGLTTRIPDGGYIASGGTTLFLAGARRELGAGACIGVHAWAGRDYTAQDVPRDHEVHSVFLDYYADIGVDPDFYWFQINAAPHEDMYWLRTKDLRKYGLIRGPIPEVGPLYICEI